MTWTEQGLGDEVLQASLIPDLSVKVSKLIVYCSQRLLQLFRSSFPNVEFCARETLDEAILASEKAFNISLIDTVAALRSRFQDFPKEAAYLEIPIGMSNDIRDGYLRPTGNVGQTPYLIGISWQSSHALHGSQNSIPLEKWKPIFEAAADLDRPVIFVAIQHGASRAYVETVAKSLGADIVFDHTIDQVGDLEMVARQVAAMDLIIATSTTTAQLAGALDQPVWHMPAAGLACGWYWMAQGERTPWYPSMHIFRRGRLERADQQIVDVAVALAELDKEK